MNNEQRQALKNLHTKQDELERIARRDRSETDAYLEANEAVIEAEREVERAGVPWWRR